jgi:glycosyltransferase involved in cell wall biosynthesis
MIHLVYPHLNKISAPNVIGHKLIEFLSKSNAVRAYNWDEFRTIIPEPGDVLIGHVCPAPFTVMKRALKEDGWFKKIIMQPYNEDVRQIGFLDTYIDDCDAFLAITGNYWFARVANTQFAHWLPKMIHLNLAVDREHFPYLKTTFNGEGKRKFLYIGNDRAGKNLDYLEEIFEKLPTIEIHTIGKVPKTRRFINHGYLNFKEKSNKELLNTFDFMITVGNADANPTTVLESMSWGLIPICTPTSGYVNERGIVNVPLGDAQAARDIIESLNAMPKSGLIQLQIEGQKALRDNYNWPVFLNKVKAQIEIKGAQVLSSEVSRVGAAIKGDISQLCKYFIKSILKNTERIWAKARN